MKNKIHFINIWPVIVLILGIFPISIIVSKLSLEIINIGILGILPITPMLIGIPSVIIVLEVKRILEVNKLIEGNIKRDSKNIKWYSKTNCTLVALGHMILTIAGIISLTLTEPISLALIGIAFVIFLITWAYNYSFETKLNKYLDNIETNKNDD